MESILITPRKKSDLKFILELTRRFGIQSKVLTEEDKEDIGLLKAMEEGKKNKIIDRSLVIKKLKNNSK